MHVWVCFDRSAIELAEIRHLMPSVGVESQPLIGLVKPIGADYHPAPHMAAPWSRCAVAGQNSRQSG